MSDDLTPVERLRLAEAATIAELEGIAAERRDLLEQLRQVDERRDRAAAASVAAGISQARVGRALDLSRSRVQQIVAADTDA